MSDSYPSNLHTPHHPIKSASHSDIYSDQQLDSSHISHVFTPQKHASSAQSVLNSPIFASPTSPRHSTASLSPNQTIIALLTLLSNPTTHWSQKLTALQRLHSLVPIIVNAANNELRKQDSSEDSVDTNDDRVSPNHAAKLMMLLSGLLSDLRCSLVKESCELMENIIQQGLNNSKIWDIMPLRKLLQLHGSPLSAMKHASEKTLQAILNYWRDNHLDLGSEETKAFMVPFLEFAEKWMRSSRVATEFEINNKRLALEYLEMTIISHWDQLDSQEKHECHARLLTVLEKYAHDKSVKVSENAGELLVAVRGMTLENGKIQRRDTNSRSQVDVTDDSPLANSADLDKLLVSNSSSPLISAENQGRREKNLPNGTKEHVHHTTEDASSEEDNAREDADHDYYTTDQSTENDMAEKSSEEPSPDTSDSDTMNQDASGTSTSQSTSPPKKRKSNPLDDNLPKKRSTHLFTKEDLIAARREGMKQTQAEVAVLVAQNQQIESDLANHRLIEEQMTQTMTILDEQVDLYKKKYNQLLDDYHRQKTLLNELQQLVDTMQSEDRTSDSEYQQRIEELESALQIEVKKRSEMKAAANEKLEVANQNVQKIHQEHIKTMKRVKELEDELQQKAQDVEENRREKEELERKVGELQNLHKMLTRDNKDLTRRTRELELQLMDSHKVQMQSVQSPEESLRLEEEQKKNRALEKKVQQLKEENEKKDEQNRELLKMLHEAVKQLERAERGGGAEGAAEVGSSEA